MHADAPHILVVDDDSRLRDLLARYLTENGFRVTTARDAADADAKLATFDVDLIVLDVMMPGESGLEVTERVRRRMNVPILLLTAMAEAGDRISGLERGADDYLAKPFEPRELVLRITRILARAAPPSVGRVIRLGAYDFDLARQRLSRDGSFVPLTSTERRLLAALAERAGDPVSRDELIAKSRIPAGSRAIDVQVTRLRRKIEPDPRVPRYLQTVRGAGYVLVPD